MKKTIVNASINLDLKKCKDKIYFDKMYNKFNRQVILSGVLDEVRLKKRFLTPSQRQKLKKQLADKRRFA